MDVERLKKLNSLAGELKGQGIVANYEDAAYLATAIHGRESEACLLGMHMSQGQSVMVQEIIKDYPDHDDPANEHDTMYNMTQAQGLTKQTQGLIREEIEMILQSFANQVSKEFTLLQEKVQQAEAKIAELSKNMRDATLPETSKHSQQTLEVSVAPSNISEKSEKSVAESPSSKMPEIKQGYSPADVSVEKMFYYGKNK